MAKVKTQYVCQNCGNNSPKWLGRCPQCSEWETFVEETVGGMAETGPGAGGSGRGRALEVPNTAFEQLGDGPGVTSREPRIMTGIQELDRVLGGGLMPKSFTLLGGDPGIGKSTLLLQMALGVVEANPGLKILYVSGEESSEQLRSRAYRLGISKSKAGQSQIYLTCETSLERAMGAVAELKPDILVMDSLQTFSSGYLQSVPGSVGQVREVTQRLMTLAKAEGVSVWLVGHVTKEGSIAGPKVVEHMVDTVLYFEGEGTQNFRLLRTVKNRFGSTRELGVFEMEGEGLKEVLNPSSLFLSERKSPVSGTAVTCSLEGTRPLLIEVQALVVPSGLAMPRRTAVGVDHNRVSLLAAILERHLRIKLSDRDLFFNVSGGIRLAEPGCDLAAAAAIYSSLDDKPIASDWVFLGELGLTGEVRRVTGLEGRLKEAAKLGFSRAFVPEGSNKKDLDAVRGKIEIVRIDRIVNLTQVI